MNDAAAIFADSARGHSRDELMALFRTLPSPAITEMDGEFAATLLDQGNPLLTAIGHFAIGNPWLNGRWLTKSFTPSNDEHGHGYNSFQRGEHVIRKFRMRTEIRPSIVDGKPSYTLIYPAYNNLCGRVGMIDEVRRIDDGVYLGFGTVGSKARRSYPMPFMLEGPTAPFVGADQSEEKNQ